MFRFAVLFVDCQWSSGSSNDPTHTSTTIWTRSTKWGERNCGVQIQALVASSCLLGTRGAPARRKRRRWKTTNASHTMFFGKGRHGDLVLAVLSCYLNRHIKLHYLSHSSECRIVSFYVLIEPNDGFVRNHSTAMNSRSCSSFLEKDNAPASLRLTVGCSGSVWKTRERRHGVLLWQIMDQACGCFAAATAMIGSSASSISPSAAVAFPAREQVYYIVVPVALPSKQ